jgi:hypothetical protein
MEIYDFGGSRSKAPAGVPTNSKVAEICQDLLTDPYLEVDCALDDGESGLIRSEERK